MATRKSSTASAGVSLRKSPAHKVVREQVFSDKALWTVQYGSLEHRKDVDANATEHLFRIVGEKLPFAALEDVRLHLKKMGYSAQGVYVAHDSMGCSRYIGRGSIFVRLAARKKEQPLELEYFSFYLVNDKKHEREVETLLIRAAGFLLEFNDRKKRVGIAPGNIHDFEAGTIFYERQRKKGAAKKVHKAARAKKVPPIK